MTLWRRDYDDYDDYGGNTEVRRVYIVGGGIPGGYGTGSRRGGELSFSPTEIKHLAMAVGILSLAFALALSNVTFNRNMNLFITMLVVSVVIVSTGFALHEIAHKFVAQKYGYWAEFRYSEFGLFIALFFGLLGWVIAVPGAVYISGNVTREENGKISAAGPLTNVALAGAFWGVLYAGAITSNDFLIFLGVFGIWINPIIAGFNMIPIYPLDGSKIWKWNPAVYIFMVVIIGAALFFAYVTIFG